MLEHGPQSNRILSMDRMAMAGMNINFDLTDEQKDIIKAARAFAEGKFPEIAWSATERKFQGVSGRSMQLGFVGSSFRKLRRAWIGLPRTLLINEEFWRIDPESVYRSCRPLSV